MKIQGEEFDCAAAIEESPAVAHWFRSLDHGDTWVWQSQLMQQLEDGNDA